MHRVRRRAAAAVAVAVAAGAVACGGGDEPAPVPQGFREHRTDAYTVAYPATWRVQEGKDERNRPFVEMNGPVNAAGAYEGQVRVGRWDRFPLAFEDQLVQFRGLAKAAGYTIAKDTKVSIDGAARAHRFEAVYSRTTASGATVRLAMTDTFVLTEDKVLLEFVVRSPEGAAARSRAPEILRSFRVKGD
ncbi:hypothetical protein [Spirillospora sp. NPDC029432]|uniref:hypothetical protein n=1 Tax=Spirillospora sp. NPDC029432 TaxID=3154599 RepID=UPI0034561242